MADGFDMKAPAFANYGSDCLGGISEWRNFVYGNATYRVRSFVFDVSKVHAAVNGK